MGRGVVGTGLDKMFNKKKVHAMNIYTSKYIRVRFEVYVKYTVRIRSVCLFPSCCDIVRTSYLFLSIRAGGGGGAGQEGPRRSTVAEATLTATLNGKPLWLKRRKGARVNQLFLEHDGKDLTRQIAK